MTGISIRLQNRHAERVVLAGLMREPAATAPELARMRFDKASLYYDVNQRTYDLLMYVFNGGVRGPLLVGAYRELVTRRDALGFRTRIEAAVHLAEVWSTDLWFSEITKWADPTADQTYPTWAAAAAALCVTHLASRRQAAYAAEELLRDSLSPAGDAEYYQSRIDSLGELP